MPVPLSGKLSKLASDHGGKCLSDDCRNTHTVVWWECAKGHKWQAPPDKTKRSWCAVCASKKRSLEDMQQLAADRGGKCLSETYMGSLFKHQWECAKSHRWPATPGSVANGSWCPFCAGNARPTIEDMQYIAAERGGKCLSESYLNSQTKLLWECSEGHRWESTPNRVKSGKWCPQCYEKTRGDSTKLTIEEMRQIAKGRGGRCLSEVYINTRTKLKWECGEGHSWEATPHSVKRGTWCPKCYVSSLTRRKQERSK